MNIYKIIMITSLLLGHPPLTWAMPLLERGDFHSAPELQRNRRTVDFGVVTTVGNENGNVSVISVKGNYFTMGQQYGAGMKEILSQTYDLVIDRLVNELNYNRSYIMNQTVDFNDRYMSTPYGDFLQGMANGANLSLQDCQILNAMETFVALPSTQKMLLAARQRSQRLNSRGAGDLESKNLSEGRIGEQLGYCSFGFAPPALTGTGKALIGRTYDFFPEFKEISKEITVTFLFPDGGIPTAIISQPGQIYCPTCITATGNFLEFNAGMPSGGDEVRNVTSLLISLLTTVQNTSIDTLDLITESLVKLDSDFSLIVNLANATTARSIEYSTAQNLSYAFFPEEDEPFASTNFFQSPVWENVQIPTDDNAWYGVSRLVNMLNTINCFRNGTSNSNAYPLNYADKENISLLSSYTGTYDCKGKSFLDFINVTMAEGGVVWWNNSLGGTVYEVFYDTAQNELQLLKADTTQWVAIPLGEYFCAGGHEPSCSSSSSGLLKNQLAGIVVGSILGSAALLGLVVWALRFLRLSSEAKLSKK